MLQDALEASLAVIDKCSRAEALNKLAPQLTGSFLRDALKAVLAIDDERIAQRR